MHLRNSFSNETRNLYLDRYDCDECGSNQGLELHHICGRVSYSPLNASVLCNKCHSHMSHNEEEEQRLFIKNLKFLKVIGYKLVKEDYEFINKNSRLIHDNKALFQWLQSK